MAGDTERKFSPANLCGRGYTMLGRRLHIPKQMNLQMTLERRNFLRGLGTALALPWLESLAPRGARAASAVPPKRMAFIYMPNGAIMPQWTPKGEGRDYELSSTLKALEPVRDQIQVLSGLAHEKAEANGDGGGDHARANATFLTARQARKTAGADIQLGVSVDQVAAAKLGHLTRFPSVELGCDKPRGSGKCDSGYSCAYQYNMAWKSKNQPMPPEHDPKLAFERLFGAEKKDTAQRQAISQKYDKSLLDFVLDDAKRLQKKLGQTDRNKLDQYLASVREIEQRIGQARKESLELSGFDKPTGIPGNYRDHLRIMFDIMLLAFQSDSTRIMTFLQGHDGSNRSFNEVGVREGHHSLTHHRGDQVKIDKISKIDRFYMANFAEFLQKMNKVKEGEGTLLDNCAIIYGSGHSDANRHDHNDLPVILAGGRNMGYQPGRHLKWEVKQNTPMANLYLTMLDRIGAETESLGDSTGTLIGV